MNQSVLLNDDLRFNDKRKSWCLTGQVNGEKITVVIDQCYLSATSTITNSLVFDIEDQIEQWLDIYEIDDNQEILLKFYT